MITLRKTPLLALALLLCLAPAAFGAEAALSKTTLFVDAPWVKENASKLIFVDARASSLYAKGHIPGAVNAEWTYFANVKGQPGNPGWGEIFPQDTLAKKIGALGINGKQPIVVYGDCGGWGQEGWAAWVFRLSGIDNVRILDGGYHAWLAAGGKVSTTAAKPKAVAFSIKAFQGGTRSPHPGSLPNSARSRSWTPGPPSSTRVGGSSRNAGEGTSPVRSTSPGTWSSSPT